jgi:hypothetical protein
MKIKLLILSFLLISFTIQGQVSAGQVDDFENGTTMNWIKGGASALPVTNISTDGPAGVDDNYIQNQSIGGGGPDSKMVFYNSAQWTGNYTNEAVVAIKMDVRVQGPTTLNLRIAFQNSLGSRICTSIPVVIAPSASWQNITIPVEASNFTFLSGGSTIEDVLTDVLVVRILSSTSPAWQGDTLVGTLEVDNITASTTLSTPELTRKEFSISPNPASSKLNVFLPNNFENANITVFDILGKKVYNRTVNGLTSKIDVSKWNSGVYLVRVSNDNATQTKRFVKQ